jgi:hypothetical protein
MYHIKKKEINKFHLIYYLKKAYKYYEKKDYIYNMHLIIINCSN